VINQPPLSKHQKLGLKRGLLHLEHPIKFQERQKD
jgi:hypothetical protein